MKKTWDGKHKNFARSSSLDFPMSNKHAGLCLPGAESRCLNEIKLRHPNKKMILIEKSSAVAQEIKKQHKHEIAAGQYELFVKSAAVVPIKKKVDFAYLDFIGSMDETMFQWLRTDLIPALTAPSRVAFCFNFAWRPETPFLLEKEGEYEKSGSLHRITCKYPLCNDHQIATYLLLFEELFQDFTWNFQLFGAGLKPFFKYNDNVNPMVLYVVDCLERSRHSTVQLVRTKMKNPPPPKKTAPAATAPKKKTSERPTQNCVVLCDRFAAAEKNGDLNGWKRSLTIYCRNREKETGTPAARFRAAIKMRLRKMGHDPSDL